MPDPTPGDEWSAPEEAGRLPTLASEVERLALRLPRGAGDAFTRYLGLVLEWNERAGLTSVTGAEEIERRHFAESLALLVALREAGVYERAAPVRVADLGPGGGFPGLPMRIADPAIELTLIESQERRCHFLREVAEALGLDDVAVVHARAEEAGRDPALRASFDLVVARALAAMPVLVEYALPLLREGGVLAAPKGSRARSELEDARRAIELLGGEALEPAPLPVAPGAPPQHVLLVRRTGLLDERYPRRPGMPSKRPL